MSTITLRSVKGSPLTNAEVDANFNNLNTDKLESSVAAATYAPLTGTGTSGTWPINVSGVASNVSGTVAVANGGTGATTVAGAQANLQVDPAGTAVAMAIALG